MASDPRHRRETRLLGMLAMTLAALAAWQVLAVFDDAPGAIAQPVRLPAAASAAGEAAAVDTAAITERPLFVPTRRRAMPIAAAVAAEPPPPPPVRLASRFQLVGIVVTEGRAAALLRAGAAGATVRVREGEAIEDWILAGTAPGRAAVFARGEERETLRLPRIAAGSTTPGAAPAAAMDDEEDDEEEEASRRGRGR